MASFTLEEQAKMVDMLFFKKKKRMTQTQMDEAFGKDREKKQNKKQVLANLIKAQEKVIKQYVEE